MILFLFLDGVGIGDDDPDHNPFLTAEMPVWRGLAGDAGWPTLADLAPRSSAHATLIAADATLGVAGTPQSGTGTTALLTGVNAAAWLGKHDGPYPANALRPLLREENLLAVAHRAGQRVAFANAFPPFYLDRVARGRARRTTATQAALATGLPLRGLEGLIAGRALSSWITHEEWRRFLPHVPEIDCDEAGRNLARLAQQKELTLFEYFHTDHRGHRNNLPKAVTVVERLDQFLGGILSQLDPAHSLLVMASDHGNFEAQHHSDHTTNPVLVTLWGQGHAALAAQIQRITDLARLLRAHMALPALPPSLGGDEFNDTTRSEHAEPP
ncbi:MAG: hypothetical protein KDD73_02180 [Anaerolineales bacterium]|nr:hypothetical protein [Anaerolineales bacterium]MCB9127258.1 peptidase [Ardenticatenales bacterium]